MSSSSPNLTKKYRPYFTHAELIALRDACLTINQPELYRYLYRFVQDIEDGLRVPNHTLQPTISQRLELDSPMENTNPHTKTPAQLYAEWCQRNKSFIGFSPAAIESINQYRYENDLMTPEEEAEYLAGLFR